MLLLRYQILLLVYIVNQFHLRGGLLRLLILATGPCLSAKNGRSSLDVLQYVHFIWLLALSHFFLFLLHFLFLLALLWLLVHHFFPDQPRLLQHHFQVQVIDLLLFLLAVILFILLVGNDLQLLACVRLLLGIGV